MGLFVDRIVQFRILCNQVWRTKDASLPTFCFPFNETKGKQPLKRVHIQRNTHTYTAKQIIITVCMMMLDADVAEREGWCGTKAPEKGVKSQAYQPRRVTVLATPIPYPHDI